MLLFIGAVMSKENEDFLYLSLPSSMFGFVGARKGTLLSKLNIRKGGRRVNEILYSNDILSLQQTGIYRVVGG